MTVFILIVLGVFVPGVTVATVAWLIGYRAGWRARNFPAYAPMSETKRRLELKRQLKASMLRRMDP